MARHRNAYSGERLTARFDVPLTPSDHAAIIMAATVEGISPTDFGRRLLLNGLRAHRIGTGKRAEQRAALVTVVERLIALGLELNAQAKKANENKRIKERKALIGVCERISAALAEVPSHVPGQVDKPVTKKLLGAVAAIGNNKDQLKKLAEAGQLFEVNAALLTVEHRIMAALDKAVPG